MEKAVPEPHQILQALVVTAVALMPWPAAAASFECPAKDVPQASGQPDLSPDEMPGLQPKITQRVKTAILKLRKEGIKSGDIIDKLVVAYCSRLEPETSLSNEQKAKQVRSFASQLTRVIYKGATTPDEEDILINLAVPPPLYAKIQRAAEMAHVSQEAWISQALKQQTNKP